VGPGKIALLEQIAALGSISAGGRAMDMSYRRAWELIEELNTIFGKPVVDSRSGGKKGGGATLTPLGLALISRYRAMERAAAAATEPHLKALAAEIAKA
jgi:molybdate transport system regulatory protein